MKFINSPLNIDFMELCNLKHIPKIQAQKSLNSDKFPDFFLKKAIYSRFVRNSSIIGVLP